MATSTVVTLLLLPFVRLEMTEGQRVAMIKQLGSRSFAQRDAATKWLLRYPDAAPALKNARRTADLEVARRVASILDRFERDRLQRQPLGRLETAVSTGAVHEAIEILAAWPQGHQEAEAWNAAVRLAGTLFDLHRNQCGAHIELSCLTIGDLPMALTAERILETETYERKFLFLRAGDVALQERKPPNGSLIVASGSVRIHSPIYFRTAVFARGSIELQDVGHAIIVSYEDVHVHHDIGNALVIARGKVTIHGAVANCRIISAKSVVLKAQPRNSQIREHDAHPLGFIRFDEAPPKQLTK